jgi:hypothetical protein
MKISCPYLESDTCRVASSSAGFPVKTYPETCKACKQGTPVIQGLITLQKFHNGTLDNKVIINYGVGSELKKLISWFPIPAKSSCQRCKSLENKMNLWGPEKCQEKIEYIIKKLHITSKRKNIPFSALLARKLINKAIRTFKQKYQNENMDLRSNHST